jgi:transcriptional regulator with XRE-family HTH domain
LTIEGAFGEVIRDLRKTNQISQEKLAEISNLDRSFISLLECGRKQPSLITIFQLAKALNLSASKILSLVEEKIKKHTGTKNNSRLHKKW